MKGSLVDVCKVSKKFGAEYALKEISFSIPKGKIVALAGPDGAGKTTLIRLIAGLLLPSDGTIKIDGNDSVQEAEAIHEKIGYMPQQFGLYDDLTVEQNLTLYADLQGVAKEKRAQVFERLFAFTGLFPFKKRLAGNLSGGMKQKLGLSCTLIRKPVLLLLDEPTVGIDPISRKELWEMVQNLVSEGISVLWSTAYLDEAEKCSFALLLNEGKLLYQGEPKDLTKRVEGRVFKVEKVGKDRRAVLVKILEQPEILDGIIQGNTLRLLTKEGALPSLDVKVEKATPRFEDAFIDLLGGGPGSHSLLAEKFQKTTGREEKKITAQDLTKKFGSFTAASEITFEVRRGEIFGLLGPNGAGKSTTFKMLCGLLKPTSGKATVNGVDLQKAPSEARSHIGYMAQKFSLYGDLSVMQNLLFFSGAYNLQGTQRKRAVEEMIEIFELQEYVNTRSMQLPLGFKQRLALSCALMHRPEILFLDEPTSGVDPITRREFWNHINGLVQKGITIMITTHFMNEAEYCDRIALIYQSKLITIGTPDELKESAKTEEIPTPTLEDAFIYRISHHE